MKATTHALLALGLFALFGLPLATAQLGMFGTQVKVGDADHMPLTKSDGIALKVNSIDFGGVGKVQDRCVLIDTGSTAAAGAQVKDIRLTPCQGRAAGTQIVAGDPETLQGAAYAQAVTTTVYVDLTLDGKYEAPDPVFITTGGASALAPPSGTTWSVRLTPSASGPSGSFVMATDADFMAYSSTVKVLPDGPAVVEREDKEWYLTPRVPGAATVAKSIPRGSMVPAHSIRIAGPIMEQPNVAAQKVTIMTEAPAAGSDLLLSVDIQNIGKSAGAGVLFTRLGSTPIDVRMTPILGASEKATIFLNVKTPATMVGLQELRVNDVFQVVSLSGTAPPGDAALVERIAALEQRLADIEDAKAVEIASENGVAKQAKGQAPGVEAVLVLVLAGIAISLRRRD